MGHTLMTMFPVRGLKRKERPESKSSTRSVLASACIIHVFWEKKSIFFTPKITEDYLNSNS